MSPAFYNPNYFVPLTSVKYLTEEPNNTFIIVKGSQENYIHVTDPIKLVDFKEPTIGYILGNSVYGYYVSGWIFDTSKKEKSSRFITIPLDSISMIRQIRDESCEIIFKEDRGCIYITGLLSDLVKDLLKI